MNTTIVLAHPWPGSFNHAIANGAVAALASKGAPCTLLDLYADGFDPVMRQEDLALYTKGQSATPLVQAYNKVLDATQQLAFIFPVWWYGMPAMLQGFFDKVMLHGTAFADDGGEVLPLRHMKKTWVVTTSFATTHQLVHQFGNPINTTMINGTFKALGFNNAQWLNLGGIDATTHQQRQAFIQQVAARL